MKFIVEKYMEKIIDSNSAEDKYDTLMELQEDISEFELMNDLEFERFHFSKSGKETVNGCKMNVVYVYEMIKFSNIFGILIKKDYTEFGDIMNVEIMEYFNEVD